MRKLIGLAGKAGSGKSALADHICTTSHVYLQDSFAAPMKAGLSKILGITVDELEVLKNEGATHPNLNVTYRSMLQTIGTGWGRDLVNKSTWVLLAKERIFNDPMSTFIMTDVRFNNEADMIHELGGIIMYIDRPADKCRDVGKHISENALDMDKVDFTLYNNGNTLESLYDMWNNLAFLTKED